MYYCVDVLCTVYNIEIENDEKRNRNRSSGIFFPYSTLKTTDLDPKGRMRVILVPCQKKDSFLLWPLPRVCLCVCARMRMYSPRRACVGEVSIQELSQMFFLECTCTSQMGSHTGKLWGWLFSFSCSMFQGWPALKATLFPMDVVNSLPQAPRELLR